MSLQVEFGRDQDHRITRLAALGVAEATVGLAMLSYLLSNEMDVVLLGGYFGGLALNVLAFVAFTRSYGVLDRPSEYQIGPSLQWIEQRSTLSDKDYESYLSLYIAGARNYFEANTNRLDSSLQDRLRGILLLAMALAAYLVSGLFLIYEAGGLSAILGAFIIILLGMLMVCYFARKR